MITKVKQFILDNHLCSKEDTIICAVSGGVDSICLLTILHALGYKTVLAHVNHHKREESEIEQKEMEKLAIKLAIPFELYHFYDTYEDNFQDKAHHARYDFFKTIAQKYNTSLIATAHHLDDQAETILMRLITGSNLYGYAGISIKQKMNDFTFIRPLLCTYKAELYSYAKANHLSFFEDASNQSDAYLRNRIRHHVLPLLKKENSNALEKFQEFSVQTKEAFNFIRKQSIKYLEEFNNNISISSFQKLDIAVKKDIICLLLEKHSIEKSMDIIRDCMALTEKKKNSRLSLKNQYWFRVEYGNAYIEPQITSSKAVEKLELTNKVQFMEKYLFYFSKKIPQNNANYIKLCYNDLKLPFFIRNRNKGDFIKMSYGNKKVARILIDAKIPQNKRDAIPLIFDNEGDLIWIYNLAKSKDTVLQKSKGDIFLVCEEINNG